MEVLVTLFEALYYASLRTEESTQIAFHIVYLDPANPDPKPPERIRNDRWSSVAFAQHISVTVPNLVKIAKASDPRTSSFAVYHNARGRLFVWGLVDQGNRYHDYVNYDSDLGPERPGLFQASIVSAGHLIAYIGYEKIAELRVDVLARRALDVLWDGPVSEALEPGIQLYLRNVKHAVGESLWPTFPEWEGILRHQWVSSLCRLLLRMRNYRHGGALLITPDLTRHGLNVKYGMRYERLRSSLETNGKLRIMESFVSDVIWSDYVEQSIEEIPLDLYLDDVVFADDLRDSSSELDGTIWFISLLSRVDGLILMNPSFEVQGFGVEIVLSEEPSILYKATSCRATKSRRRSVDYNHFGTRHRSMMRYCAQVKGSVGFVVSQDGDVRAITKVGNQLLMWENIKLQHHSFVSQAR